VKLNTLLNCLDMSMVVDHLSINVDMNEKQNMAVVFDPEFKAVSPKRLRSRQSTLKLNKDLSGLIRIVWSRMLRRLKPRKSWVIFTDAKFVPCP